MGDLSAHFDSSEFFRHGGAGSITIDPALIRVLEHLRAIDDRPLPIVSGYRSPAYNRLVGGAPNSQHLYGRAADIPSRRYTVAQALAAGARGVGYCGPWVVHLDTREGTVVTFKDC